MDRFQFSFPNLLLMALAAYVFICAVSLARSRALGEGRLRRRLFRIIYLYAGWIGLLTLLATRGFFDQKTLPPRFALIFAAVVAVSTALTLLRVKGRLAFLAHTPLHWLLYFQAFRVLVELVLWMLYAEKLVPREMTFEGRNFDILVGLTAPLAGWLVQHKKWLNAGIAFNVFGLLALVNIVSIVLFAFPSPFQRYETIFIASYFPGIFIPALLAPVATYVHILSLKQLLAAKKQGQALAIPA